MNDPAVSAHASSSEAIVDHVAAFEDFFRVQTQSLYAHLCLITGNRAEAEELAQDAVPEGLGAMGPRGRHGGAGRLSLPDGHEPVPQAVPQGGSGAPQDGLGRAARRRVLDGG